MTTTLSPSCVAAWQERYSDPVYRLTSGELYKIIDKDSKVIPFAPNAAQNQFIREMHTRNVIPKARQRGISTVIQILMLDTALFTDNFRGVIIAQDEDAATAIFRDKLKFAYNQLPPYFRRALSLMSDSKTEILLTNGSSVKVTTSARSGTVNMLHVSEMGKIAAKFPDKATEIMTGSIPSVTPDGMIFVESTAEGREGEFYELVQRAIRFKDSGVTVSPLDFKLHFYSWWDAAEYSIDPDGVVITNRDHEYFNKIERQCGCQINERKRAWYCKTREGFNDSNERMYQEFPSTVDEPFQVSTEGTYFAEQLSRARKENRIRTVPHDPTLPVSTFWDIGANDETAVWCIQQDHKAFNVINYTEATGETFAYFVNWLKDTSYTWASHYLPHDADHKRQLGMRNMSAREMIQELSPGWNMQTVPRIPNIIDGIQQVRNVFPRCYFDAEKCKDGLKRLELYRKEWDKTHSCWKPEPRHDANSNGADAFRQFAQALYNGQMQDYSAVVTGLSMMSSITKNWRV